MIFENVDEKCEAVEAYGVWSLLPASPFRFRSALIFAQIIEGLSATDGRTRPVARAHVAWPWNGTGGFMSPELEDIAI